MSLRLVKASTILEKPLTWLWEGLIPCGQVTLIEGDPGTAKSQLTIALAAHVTTGKPWPDGRPCLQGSVILSNAEDPEEEVLKPRLVAAGADVDKCIILLPNRDEEQFNIGGDHDNVSELEATIRNMSVKLVVFDPLEAFLGGAVDNYRNHHVRRALRSLELMAKRLICSVILVRHLTKATDKAAIYRGGGSIGIIGAARAALSVAKDKTTKGRCIMVPVKQNWTEMRGGIAYRPTEMKYTNELGEVITTVHVVWDGSVDVTADDIITADSEPGMLGATEECAQFIREQLEAGPCKATDIFDLALRQGISRKTMYRTSQTMGIHKYREGGLGAMGAWWWEIVPQEESDLLKAWGSGSDSLTLIPDAKPVDTVQAATLEQVDDTDIVLQPKHLQERRLICTTGEQLDAVPITQDG